MVHVFIPFFSLLCKSRRVVLSISFYNSCNFILDSSFLIFFSFWFPCWSCNSCNRLQRNYLFCIYFKYRLYPSVSFNLYVLIRSFFLTPLILLRHFVLTACILFSTFLEILKTKILNRSINWPKYIELCFLRDFFFFKLILWISVD